jgi:acyl-coenzyme A synthetase/AMP-(fatty) acid ligase
VRRVFSSGAPLPADLAVELAARGFPVTEVLGSSETGGIAWREQSQGSPAYFCPLPGIRVDADADEHLLVDSPLLPADSARPYRSADRARLVGDGRFVHLGRADGVLKIGSMRVSVAELEQHLRAIDGVDDAAVLPVEVGGARGWETWAVLVAPGLDAQTVRRGLRLWLDPVLLPRRYRFVEHIPRGDTGKLRRAALEALFAKRGRS